MRNQPHDLLDVLKKELEFVEKGGYKNPESRLASAIYASGFTILFEF